MRPCWWGCCMMLISWNEFWWGCGGEDYEGDPRCFCPCWTPQLVPSLWWKELRSAVMTSEHNKKFTHIIYIYTVYRMTGHSMTIYEMTEGSDLTLSCGGALVLFLIDASRQGTWGTGSMCYSSGPGSYLYSVTSMQQLCTFVMQSGKGEIPQLYPPAWTEPSCSKVRGRYPGCTFLDG